MGISRRRIPKRPRFIYHVSVLFSYGDDFRRCETNFFLAFPRKFNLVGDNKKLHDKVDDWLFNLITSELGDYTIDSREITYNISSFSKVS